MAFIRIHKLVRDNSGNIVSDSAAIKESQYVKDGGKFHSKKIVRERVLCHILHGILRDGSNISCDCFMEKSFASYILDDIPSASLHCDTPYFLLMGKDSMLMAFFKAFIKRMRKEHPDFGRCCYVDSTPLPNDIDNNPFNALCSHGVESTSIQTRLVLILDEETGLPVWYDIIPGNVLDISTIMTVVNDVSTSLDITIGSLVLDAGYISKEVIGAFHNGSEKTFIGRMPARKGFPFKTLYHEFKTHLDKGKYRFVRGGHVYFGKRKEIELFGKKVFAYVYVDMNNALQRERYYMLNHPDEYAEMKDKDKDKDWFSVRFGYFVLLSNRNLSPEALLAEYFERADIEGVIKTSKEYLGLLPLSKWTVDTVRGKILNDIINTIVFLNMRKTLDNSGISVSEVTGGTQSLMCFRNKHGEILIETPNNKVKTYYNLIGETIPASLKIKDFRKMVLVS